MIFIAVTLKTPYDYVIFRFGRFTTTQKIAMREKEKKIKAGERKTKEQYL